ncbi:hypothetical protein FRC03_003352 [Tulasnella sp. 419]|nr:hypothetical protein FRC02_012381 [Tulasnella sp. 418]KAG8963151.1 hypothetical protein FRC03_003352 [Tulasnella sp. 419]
MPPKKAEKKDGGKGKAKGTTPASGEGSSSSDSKLKAATSVNVRHILCEKHSKATEALEKIKNGERFDKVAQEYSEDKAKGMFKHAVGIYTSD